MKVIIDSDIGDDITDAFALAFALQSPKLEIKAIISNNGYEKERAMIVHKLVKAAGQKIPVFQGLKGGKGRLTNQKKFIKNYKYRPKKLEDNLDFFRKLFKEEIYYISLGTLTNISYLIKKIPSIKNKTKFLMMAGSLFKDYHGKNKTALEWNIHCDVSSARKVFQENLDVTLVPLDSTWDLFVPKKSVSKIINQESSLHRSLKELYQIWKKSHQREPIEFDSFTVALLVDPSLAGYRHYRISIDDKGRMYLDNQGLKVRVAMSADKRRFLRLFFRCLNLTK